jgi:hypothetical protein
MIRGDILTRMEYCRRTMDYEFDIVFDIDLNHNAMSTKDRSSLFDGKMIPKPDERIGVQILERLNRGVVLEGAFNTLKKPAAVPSSKPAATLKAQPTRATAMTAHIPPSANPLVTPAAAERIPLFSDPATDIGEKETAAMLEAIANATTSDRLSAIDKSRRLGFDTNRLTLQQARKIRQAIDKRQSEIAATKTTKAA